MNAKFRRDYSYVNAGGTEFNYLGYNKKYNSWVFIHRLDSSQKGVKYFINRDFKGRITLKQHNWVGYLETDNYIRW